MNPTILKALIISGGALGISVPSLYYAYPHISSLIKSGKESKPIKLTEDVAETSKVETEKSLPVTNEQEVTDSPTGSPTQAPGKVDTPSPDSGEKSDSNVGDNKGSPGANPTQQSIESGDNQRQEQNK